MVQAVLKNEGDFQARYNRASAFTLVTFDVCTF